MRDASSWLITNLETVLKLTQLMGIPIAILLYLFNKRKERRDKDYGTYDSLDDKYIDYLKLCLQYPHLDVADIPRPNAAESAAAELTPEQQRDELMVFSVLLSIMERAYLMYKDRWYNVKEVQWNGWEDYIRGWLDRPNFRRALDELLQGFDQRFVDYMEDLKKQPTT
jgi:hypothetical protein